MMMKLMLMMMMMMMTMFYHYRTYYSNIILGVLGMANKTNYSDVEPTVHSLQIAAKDSWNPHAGRAP